MFIVKDEPQKLEIADERSEPTPISKVGMNGRGRNKPGISRGKGQPAMTGQVIADMERRGAPIWKQLENETIYQYRMFEAYRDFGPERSLSKLAMGMGHKGTPGHITEAAAGYKWARRAEAYDMWVLNQKQLAEARQMEQAADKWAARQIQVREEQHEIGDFLLYTVRERLYRARGKQLMPDGSTQECEAEPLRIQDKELPMFAKAGAALKQAALQGYAAQQQSDEGIEDIMLPADLTEATDEELRRILNKAQSQSPTTQSQYAGTNASSNPNNITLN